MAVVLALISSAVYGIGDFFGGLTARRLPPLVVGFITHAMVVIPMVIVASLIGAESFTQHDIAWSAGAAVAGEFGVVLLYRGLAVGPMSVVSPVAAVVSTAIPVFVGALTDVQPRTVQWLGISIAVLAIVLVSQGEESSSKSGGPVKVQLSTLLASIGAGAGFGLFFVALAQTGEGSGLWPIAFGRMVSSSLFALVVLATVRPLRGITLGKQVVGLAALTAAGDLGANAAYLLAVRRGDLALVSVLSSLYPASTVLLARIALGERLRGRQQLGLGIATVAIVLVAGGG